MDPRAGVFRCNDREERFPDERGLPRPRDADCNLHDDPERTS